MIAKLVVHGATRPIALGRLAAALDRTEVAGSVTNVAFLAALARQPDFAEGRVDTGLIARELDALTEVAAVAPQRLAQAAMAGAGLLGELSPLAGFALWQPLVTPVTLRLGGDDVPAGIAMTGRNAARVEVAGQTVAAERIAGEWRFDGRPAAGWHLAEGKFTLFGPGGFEVEIVDPLERAAAHRAGTGVIEAPMPGLVRAVAVRPGDDVTVGQRLAVLEAMKMEHALVADRDGRVAEVLVEAGAQVEAGAPLIRLEAEE